MIIYTRTRTQFGKGKKGRREVIIRFFILERLKRNNENEYKRQIIVFT